MADRGREPCAQEAELLADSGSEAASAKGHDEAARLREELAWEQAETARLREELARLRELLERTERESYARWKVAEEMRKALGDVEKSWSFRLSRSITAPARWLLGRKRGAAS